MTNFTLDIKMSVKQTSQFFKFTFLFIIRRLGNINPYFVCDYFNFSLKIMKDIIWYIINNIESLFLH